MLSGIQFGFIQSMTFISSTRLSLQVRKMVCALNCACQDLTDINQVNLENVWCKDEIIKTFNCQFYRAETELCPIQFKLCSPAIWLATHPFHQAFPDQSFQ